MIFKWVTECRFHICSVIKMINGIYDPLLMSCLSFKVRASEDGTTDNTSQQQTQQPNRLDSFLAVTKSLIIRALLIYFITSFFRRPQDTSISNQSGGKMGSQSVRIAAVNIFDDGTLLVSEVTRAIKFHDLVIKY